MTTIAQKLKAAVPPFETHFVGKWHCGARSPANLPIRRGFDTHLGFLKGMEDHFTQRSDFNMYAEKYVDLWNDEQPASNDLNGTCLRCDTHPPVRLSSAFQPRRYLLGRARRTASCGDRQWL
jgi:hypothetical protein